MRNAGLDIVDISTLQGGNVRFYDGHFLMIGVSILCFGRLDPQVHRYLGDRRDY